MIMPKPHAHLQSMNKNICKVPKDRNRIIGVALTKKLLIVSSDEVHKLKKVKNNVQTPCSSLDHEQNTYKISKTIELKL